MVAFPAISALISLICALVIARDAMRRPRPDKAAWAIAFAVFAIAAGAEVVGSLAGWTTLLARVYYLTGAVLVVGYLALGELYLLVPRGGRFAAIAPGATLLVTAVAAAVVWAAPVDAARLGPDGWEAIERGPGLIALAAGINSLGTAIIVGGLGVSAWRFWRQGIQRNRMIGCLLILVGTLVVAAGGTLTRFGHREYLYIAMAAGVAVIFAGYLQTRRPDTAGFVATGGARDVAAPGAGEWAALVVEPQVAVSADEDASTGRSGIVPLPIPPARSRRTDGPGVAPADPGIAFLEERFLPLDDLAASEACRVWSVDRPAVDRFDRAEARRVWVLRQRLSSAGQAAFDGHPVPVQLQLAELYHEVLAPGATGPSTGALASGG
ncbi:MAG: hypothetical protein M3Q03_00970 [Chloroflexota bacterium]|nr:hypothetical protein [Chloroflexota bacterium]